mgnify:FL=1
MCSSDLVYVLLQRELEKAGMMNFVGDAIKTGALASLMIAKVHGKTSSIPVFSVKTEFSKEGTRQDKLLREESKSWNLFIELIRPEDFYPDPTGAGLYQCQNMWVDKADVLALCEGEDAIYDKEKALKLTSYSFDQYYDESDLKDRETDQSRTYSDYRVRVKLTECWGNIIEPVTGEVLFENVTWTVANDTILLSPPRQNPFWHGKSPFVVAPITRVLFSVDRKSTRLNSSHRT